MFEEIKGNKKLIASVTGKMDEEKEIRIKRSAETAVYTVAVRNKIMHEAGVTLVSYESEGVEVPGKKTFTGLFEHLLSGF